MKSWIRVVVLAVLTWIYNGTIARAAETTYTVAVVPQFAPVRIFNDWRPLLDRLEHATGYRFKLLTYTKISDFDEAVFKGIPDFAFMNPYLVVMVHKTQDYRPLVRDNRELTGLVVVRRNSSITSLSQLNGQSVAFPAPNAFGASLLLRAEFASMHMDVKPEYVGSHQNVYRAVARGDVAAGGGIRETLSREPPALQAQLRVLYVTPGVAPHPFAASPRVPEAVAQKITEALLALRNSVDGRRLLRAVQLNDPIQTSFDRDYAPLEKLDIDRFVTEPKP